MAVSWWAQQWPEEEQWPRRALQLAPPGTDPGWWRLLARDAVTYPETVALASVLVDERFRRRLLAESGGHLPHTLADTPALVSKLAQITNRGWLPEKIASTSAGPLLVWVHNCVRSHAGADAADRLWTLHMAHRPRPIARELQAYRDAGSKPEAVSSPSRGRGIRLTPEQAFHTGLAHARAYAAHHGHLAAPIGERFNGFALGRWLSNHRKSAAVPPEHVAELEVLDPWWRPPWTVMWQRTYYEARDHARAGGGLRPERGFPATSFGLGEWLYIQCTAYDDLHPAQQRLLSDIGLTPEAVRSARPRRKHMATHFERTLAGARAFARIHGTLVAATAGTIQDGFKLGQWLANQRSKDRAYQLRHGTPSPRALALSAIDPWWNPPWALKWQRSWHQAQKHVQDGHVLDAAAGFPGTSSALATWLTNQCAQYDTLKPTSRTSSPGSGWPRTEPRRGRTAAEHEADFAVGLGYARSYHSTHGTLATANSTVHGFELGRWLRRQRQHARPDADRGAPHSAAAKALTAVDPWWCPPWSLAWQRSWQHIHHQVGRPPARRHARVPQLLLHRARLATPTDHAVRRPASRPAAPPGRHRPHRGKHPHPARHPVRRNRTGPCQHLHSRARRVWQRRTAPSTTASPWGPGWPGNASWPRTRTPPTPSTTPWPRSTPGGTRPGPCAGSAPTTTPAPHPSVRARAPGRPLNAPPGTSYTRNSAHSSQASVSPRKTAPAQSAAKQPAPTRQAPDWPTPAPGPTQPATSAYPKTRTTRAFPLGHG